LGFPTDACCTRISAVPPGDEEAALSRVEQVAHV
jgi:hypothetical protein